MTKRALGGRALDQFRVNMAGAFEELSWTLFDYATYANAGQTSLSFFQSPVGAAGKTFADTNMDLAGQIPAGQSFIVTAIGVDFFPSQSPEATIANNKHTADVYAVMKSGILEFKIGSKLYKNEGPLERFPCKNRLAGFSSAATTVAATNIVVDYAKSAGQIHEIVPVKLTSNQNFVVTLKWPSVVALPSAADGRIGVHLYGSLFRNVQ